MNFWCYGNKEAQRDLNPNAKGVITDADFVAPGWLGCATCDIGQRFEITTNPITVGAATVNLNTKLPIKKCTDCPNDILTADPILAYSCAGTNNLDALWCIG